MCEFKDLYDEMFTERLDVARFRAQKYKDEASYEMHATMTRALRLEWDDVDERITEVAVPEGEKRDIDFFKNLDK